MTQAHILMCPPDHFGIEYEINPWMNRLRQSEHAVAVRQWHGLRGLLEKAGARVSRLTPAPGLPDLVFTANAAIVHRNTAILSQFRHPERQGEEPHNRQWLAEHGFDVREMPDGMYFEGAGDALFCGDTLFAGYRIRSAIRAHQLVGRMLDCRVLPMELVDPYYYHLDTCFCPLAPEVAAYYPNAFDEYGRRTLETHVGELIAVDADEAARFSCNAVVVGRTVITNTGCPNFQRELERRGFAAWETPLDEYVKAGGSAKCLTLRLDGEEAAAWKQEEAVAVVS